MLLLYKKKNHFFIYKKVILKSIKFAQNYIKSRFEII